MDNEDKLNLKCNLCDKSHEYEFSDSPVNAIEAEWRSLNQNPQLLSSSPKIGNEYFVTLHSPLTLKKKEPFWVVYLNPNSSINGIEKEQDLIDVSFCKCEYISLIEISDTNALIKIKVNDVKKIDDFIENIEPAIAWQTLLNNNDTFKKYGSTDNYKTYSYIDINIESDLGISAVVKKQNNESYIAAINQWDFHLNEWILCRIPLDKKGELKYGIQHVHRN